LLIVLSAFLLLFLSSCHPSEQAPSPGSRLIIGVPVQILNGLTFIAENRGYFRQEGIDAELKTYPSGKQALEALMSGEVDVATASETPFVCKAIGGANAVILATVAYSDNAVGVVARKDRDIGKPADLRGKTIATVRGSSAHYFLYCFLTEQCMNENDVKVVFYDPDQLPAALINGEVDAISMYEPYIYWSGKGLGENAIFFFSPVLYTKTFNLIVKPKAGEIPQFSAKILNALIRAEKFMATNPDEAVDIITKKIGLPKEVVSAAAKDTDFHLCLRQSLLIVMEAQAQWAMETCLTKDKKMPNFLDAIAETPLKSLNEHAVSIIK